MYTIRIVFVLSLILLFSTLGSAALQCEKVAQNCDGIPDGDTSHRIISIMDESNGYYFGHVAGISHNEFPGICCYDDENRVFVQGGWGDSTQILYIAQVDLENAWGTNGHIQKSQSIESGFNPPDLYATPISLSLKSTVGDPSLFTFNCIYDDTNPTCPGGRECVFKMSKEYPEGDSAQGHNAHASDCDYPNYGIKLCCNLEGSAVNPPSGGSIDYINGYLLHDNPSVDPDQPDITVNRGLPGDGDFQGVLLGGERQDLGGTTATQNTCNGVWESVAVSPQPPNSAGDQVVRVGPYDTGCFRFDYTVTNTLGASTTYDTTNVVRIDTSPPTGGSISLSTNDGYIQPGSRTLSITSGSDLQSGKDNWWNLQFSTTSAGFFIRDKCRAFVPFSTVSGFPRIEPTPATFNFNFVQDYCYKLRFTERNNAHLQSEYPDTFEIKVDGGDPGTITEYDGADCGGVSGEVEKTCTATEPQRYTITCNDNHKCYKIHYCVYEQGQPQCTVFTEVELTVTDFVEPAELTCDTATPCTKKIRYYSEDKASNMDNSPIKEDTINIESPVGPTCSITTGDACQNDASNIQIDWMKNGGVGTRIEWKTGESSIYQPGDSMDIMDPDGPPYDFQSNVPLGFPDIEDFKTYFFRCRVILDGAGNVGDPSASARIAVDITPPICEILPFNNPFGGGDINMEYVATDNTHLGGPDFRSLCGFDETDLDFKYRFENRVSVSETDIDPICSVSGPNTYKCNANNEGSYFFKCKVNQDYANNLGEYSDWQELIVDTENPDLTLDLPRWVGPNYQNGRYVTDIGDNFNLKFYWTGDDESGIKDYYVKYVRCDDPWSPGDNPRDPDNCGAVHNDYLGPITETEASINGEPDTNEGKMYDIKIIATDNAGRSKEDYHGGTVDLSPPEWVADYPRFRGDGTDISASSLNVIDTQEYTDFEATVSMFDIVSGIDGSDDEKLSMIEWWKFENNNFIRNVVECESADPHRGADPPPDSAKSDCSLIINNVNNYELIKLKFKAVDRAWNVRESPYYYITSHPWGNLVQKNLFVFLGQTADVKVHLRNLGETDKEVRLRVTNYPSDNVIVGIVGGQHNDEVYPYKDIILQAGAGVITPTTEFIRFIGKEKGSEDVDIKIFEINADGSDGTELDSDLMKVSVGFPASFPSVSWVGVVLMFLLAGLVFYRKFEF